MILKTDSNISASLIPMILCYSRSHALAWECISDLKYLEWVFTEDHGNQKEPSQDTETRMDALRSPAASCLKLM